MVLKASEIPLISAWNIFLFEPSTTLRSCHSSPILSLIQTTSASILTLSSLDQSQQSFKLDISFCVSKNILFLSSISSFSRNLELEINWIGPVPLAESIIKLTETWRAWRWPYDLIYWLLANRESWSDDSLGYAFLSPAWKGMKRTSLVGIELRRLKKRYVSLCWPKFNKICIGIHSD